MSPSELLPHCLLVVALATARSCDAYMRMNFPVSMLNIAWNAPYADLIAAKDLAANVQQTSLAYAVRADCYERKRPAKVAADRILSWSTVQLRPVSSKIPA
jgi:hypothetical protein